MKILVLFLGLWAAVQSHQTPSNTEARIAQLVTNFAKAADSRDEALMNEVLHDDFRAIVNRAFGGEELQLIDKQTYLDLMRKEVIGGDDRKVTIGSVHIKGTTAVVKASFQGQSLHFETVLQLIEIDKSQWKIISDMPQIRKL